MIFSPQSKIIIKRLIKIILPHSIKNFLVKTLKEITNYKGKHIIIVCMPKSGSTFLYKKLSCYTGFPRQTLYTHSTIQEFDMQKVKKSFRFDLVEQIHTYGTLYAVDQLNKLKADVIILCRNLYDLTISMADFIHSNEMRGEIEKYGFGLSFGMPWNKSFYELTKKEQYDFVIDFLIPAYIAFYVSWRGNAHLLKKPPLWVFYEDFVGEKEACFSKILEHCSLEIDQEKLREALLKEQDTRFNKGQSREKGGGILSENQSRRIEALIAHFPEYQSDLLRNTN